MLTAGKDEATAEAEADSVKTLVPRRRPAMVRGVTERVRTGHGNTYVTINFDEKGEPFELFTNVGKAGGCDSAQVEAISRLISLALRSGIDAGQLVEHLKGITCCPIWDGGTLVRSAPDAVALVLSRHLQEGVSKAETEAELVTGTATAQIGLFGPEASSKGPEKTNGGSIPRGARCPDCAGVLVHQEGCMRCADCGYNKCE